MWQRVVEFEPDRHVGWVRLGVRGEQSGCLRRSRSAVGAGNDVNPATRIPQAMLAISLSGLGDHDRAIALVQAAVDGDPNSATSPPERQPTS